MKMNGYADNGCRLGANTLTRNIGKGKRWNLIHLPKIVCEACLQNQDGLQTARAAMTDHRRECPTRLGVSCTTWLGLLNNPEAQEAT
jgi:hypothetical protein